MDISSTTAPRSDQLNFDDVTSAALTISVVEVKRGSEEQPVEIHSAEFPGRPYKPNKSMRRVLVLCWGKESSAYVGRRMTLIGDPTVKFGGSAVGGIKIAALSDIDKPQKMPLTVTRGQRKEYVVQPLADQPKTLFEALKEAGKSGKDAALAFISETLGREVGNTKELTADETAQVIAACERAL